MDVFFFTACQPLSVYFILNPVALRNNRNVDARLNCIAQKTKNRIANSGFPDIQKEETRLLFFGETQGERRLLVFCDTQKGKERLLVFGETKKGERRFFGFWRDS